MNLERVPLGAACALTLALASACNVPVSIVKAVPTQDFPRTWDQEGIEATGPAAGGTLSSTSTLAIPPGLQPRAGAISRTGAIALAIGIERYRRDLPLAGGAEADARLFASFAEVTLGVPRSNIHLLLGADATKSSIDAELTEWLPRNASSGAEVFVFFAGHGAPDPESGTRYLVPWDGDPRFIKTQGVAVEGVLTRLEKLSAEKVYAFFDACFTGAGGRSVLPAGARPLVLQKKGGLKPRRQVVVFTATGPNEVTGASTSGHGLFTYHLLRGLNGEADQDHNGTVTVGELARYTRTQVANEARRQNRDQSPQVAGAISGLDHNVLTRLPPGH